MCCIWRFIIHAELKTFCFVPLVRGRVVLDGFWGSGLKTVPPRSSVISADSHESRKLGQCKRYRNSLLQTQHFKRLFTGSHLSSQCRSWAELCKTIMELMCKVFQHVVSTTFLRHRLHKEALRRVSRNREVDFHIPNAIYKWRISLHALL